MRSWIWRVALSITILSMMLAVPVSVSAFNRACDGSLNGLRSIARVRAELAAATAPPPTPVPAPTPPPTRTSTPVAAVQATASVTPTAVPPTSTATPIPPTPVPAGPTAAQRALEVVGIAGDRVLGAVVWVKQTDAIAYPGHVALAYAVDAAGCSKDAVRLQWLKAGLHASRDGQPEQVATALAGRATTPDELADLRRVVQIWTDGSGNNVAMRQVQTLLDARG